MQTWLPKPTVELVRQRGEFDRDEKDIEQGLTELVNCSRTIPTSSGPIEGCAINQLYSRKLCRTACRGSHIAGRSIWTQTRGCKIQLVDRIAQITNRGSSPRNNLSFASKVFSWHRPEIYRYTTPRQSVPPGL